MTATPASRVVDLLARAQLPPYISGIAAREITSAGGEPAFAVFLELGAGAPSLRAATLARLRELVLGALGDIPESPHVVFLDETPGAGLDAHSPASGAFQRRIGGRAC